MKNIPILKLNDITDYSNSEEEYKNTLIKNIEIDFKLVNYLSNSEKLKFYKKMYDYKKDLDSREIQYHISDMDLIELHKNSSDVLHIQLTPLIKSDVYIIKPKKIKSLSARVEKSTKNQNIKRTKTAPSEYKYINKETFKKVSISNQLYNIYYSHSNLKFFVFKIINKNSKIYCEGTEDNLVRISELENYNIKDIYLENIKYDIIYINPMYEFKNPMFICQYENKITIEEFLNYISSLLSNFVF